MFFFCACVLSACGDHNLLLVFSCSCVCVCVCFRNFLFDCFSFVLFCFFRFCNWWVLCARFLFFSHRLLWVVCLFVASWATLCCEVSVGRRADLIRDVASELQGLGISNPPKAALKPIGYSFWNISKRIARHGAVSKNEFEVFTPSDEHREKFSSCNIFLMDNLNR